MKITWKEFAYYNYLIGIALLVISLPIFNLGMSIASFYIAGVWVVDLVHDIFWKKTPWVKFQSLSKDYVALMCIALYGLFGIGLLYSSDLPYGLHDLKIKAPLLIIPLGLSMMSSIKRVDFFRLSNLFILSTTFSVTCAVLVRFQIVEIPYQDIREITRLFITRISHVRLSLMVVLAGMLSLWQVFESHDKTNSRSRIIHLATAIYFVFFLLILKSGTGVAIWSATLLVYAFTRKSNLSRWVKPFRAATLLIVGALAIYIGYCVNDYFKVDAGQLENLESHTANGEPYEHNLDLTQIENGHYVWIYYAPNEMGTAWNVRSEVDVDSVDARGQHLRATLLRYLTSKGLRKDEPGVNALTEDDIARIEQGYASVDEGRKFPLRQRIDDIIFEYDCYLNGGNPGGNSLAQRLEYWQTGWYIAMNNPLMGVGTGDVKNAFEQAYIERETLLAPQFRLRAHNQYLTTALTLGIPIALVFTFLLLRMWIRTIRDWNVPALIFLTISILSFIPEDTLETQAGVAFFSLFVALVYKFPREESLD